MLTEYQEPKYDVQEGKIVNRKTGEPIPDDEPIMIFRAKDLRTYQMIMIYMELCRNPGHQRIVKKRLDVFKDFQEQNPDRIKEPD